MLKIKTTQLFDMIIQALTEGGKTREELHTYFNGQISTGTISARCNDLLKLNIITQNKKRLTKSKCWAFIMELNHQRCEWLPFESLDHNKAISDDQIHKIIRVIIKSERRKDIVYSIFREVPRKKLKKILGACHG